MASSASSASSSSSAPALDPNKITDYMANDLEAEIASKVKEYASDRVSAALFSLKPGNTHFELEAIVTGSETATKNGREGSLTAFFGEPYTQQLDWQTIHRRGLRFSSVLEFGRVLEMTWDRADDPRPGVFIALYWDGEELPALKISIVLTADVPSTDDLTGAKVRLLIQSTLQDAYLKMHLRGCVGEPPIPGLRTFYNLSCLIAQGPTHSDVQRFVGQFKK